MGGCKSSPMNMHSATRHAFRATRSFGHPDLWWLGMSVVLLLASIFMFSPSSGRSVSAVQIQPLVHFRDASHDWLMVVDAATGEVVVYDAASGRPLHRLGADEGLSRVTAIAREGSRLRVTSNNSAMRVLSLPGFQPVALNNP